MPAITCALACSSVSLLRSEDSSACAACSSWWIALSRSFCWRALSSKARRLSREIDPWRSRSPSMISFGVGAARPRRTELIGGGIVPGTSGPPMALKGGSVAAGSGSAAHAAGRGVDSGVASGVTIGVGCSGRGAARMDGIGAGRVTLSGSPRHICGVGDTRAQEGVELSGSGGGPHVRHSFAELQTGRVNRTNDCVWDPLNAEKHAHALEYSHKTGCTRIQTDVH